MRVTIHRTAIKVYLANTIRQNVAGEAEILAQRIAFIFSSITYLEKFLIENKRDALTLHETFLCHISKYYFRHKVLGGTEIQIFFLQST